MEWYPVQQKVVGLNLAWGTYLGCGFNPSWGVYGTNQSIFLSHTVIPLSVCFSLLLISSLSEINNKISLGKKKHSYLIPVKNRCSNRLSFPHRAFSLAVSSAWRTFFPRKLHGLLSFPLSLFSEMPPFQSCFPSHSV